MSTISAHKINTEKWLGPDSYAATRKCHEQCSTLPKYEDLKQIIGAPLTELIFQYGIPDYVDPQKLIAYKETQLEGPKEPLWISPSQELMGRVKLEISPILRGTQVFTYHTIIENGQSVENKFIRLNEEEIERRCAELRAELERKFERQLALEKDKVRRKCYELYSIRLREVFYKLKDEFQEAIKQREVELIAQGERMKNEAVEVVRRSMEEELILATKMVEESYSLKLKYMYELNNAEVREAYLQKINLYNNKWTDVVNQAKETARSKQIALINYLQQLHQINILEVIAIERNLANRMVEETAIYFIERIDCMRKEIHRLYYKLYEANHQMKCNKIELQSWECLLRDVVDQFQKFVNYVMKVVPGDAEYLLSLEKLLERRQQSYYQRLRSLGIVSEEPLPMADWERLSAKESVTSETMSAVIHAIIDFILYRGTVALSAKFPHAGVKVRKSLKELTPPVEEETEFKFCLESELTTTISDVEGTLYGLSSDKSYRSRERKRYRDKYPVGEEEGECYGEGGWFGEDGVYHRTRKPRRNLPLPGEYDDFEFFEFEEYWTAGRIFTRFDESSLKPPMSPSPTIITQYLDVTPTTISSTSSVPSSSFISPVSPDRCMDGTIIKTKSEMDAEAETFARKTMDLKFMGVEKAPCPKDKETFIQGRILSILDIMKAHPQFHNVLIEP